MAYKHKFCGRTWKERTSFTKESTTEECAKPKPYGHKVLQERDAVLGLANTGRRDHPPKV